MQTALSYFIRRRVRELIAAAALACVAVFVSCSKREPSISSTTNTPAGTQAPHTSYPMPPTTVPAHGQNGLRYGFTTMDGSRRKALSDYTGQVVVVDFWATYCPPCQMETPHLVAMQDRYGPKGLQVIGLNVGGAEDLFKVPEFAREFKIQYQLGVPDQMMTDLFMGDDDSIPQTLVFDRKGRLLKHYVGYDETMPADLERLVESSLDAGRD